MTASNKNTDFRGELLRRFFNPKSYFYSQLQSRLDEYRRSGEITEPDLEAVERFLARLEGSSDISAELVSLSHIGPFQAFHQILHDSVSRLESASLDKEGVMAEIREIAGSLADTLRTVLQSDGEGPRFLKWLGLSSEKLSESPTETHPVEPPELMAEFELTDLMEIPEADEPKPDAVIDNEEFTLEPSTPADSEPAPKDGDLALPFELESDHGTDSGTAAPTKAESRPGVDEQPVLAPDSQILPPESQEQVEVEISDEEFEAWLNSLRDPNEKVHEEVTEDLSLELGDAHEPVKPSADEGEEPQQPAPQESPEVVPAEPTTQPEEPVGEMLSKLAEPSPEQDQIAPGESRGVPEQAVEDLRALEAALQGGPAEPAKSQKEATSEPPDELETTSPASDDLRALESVLQDEPSESAKSKDEATTELKNEPKTKPPASKDLAASDSLTRVVRTELMDLLDRLEQTLPDDGGEPDTRALQHLFERFRDVAMMHGSEEIEELATKSWRLTQALNATGKTWPASALDLFRSVHSALSALLHGRSLPGLGELVQHLSRLERSPESLFEGEVRPQEMLDAAVNTARTELVPEKENLPFKENVAVDTVTTAPASEEGPPAAEVAAGEILSPDGEDIRLPGEDDQELLQLIREVTIEASANGEVEATAEVPASANEAEEPLPEPTVVPAVAETPPREAVGILERFLEEAQLYFSVFEDALSVLKQQPKDDAAREDLELAAYSLKGLCRKLGLDSVAALPEAIERYAAHLIANDRALDRDGWLAIFQSIHTLRTLGENPKERQKALWDLVRTLKHRTRTQRQAAKEQKLADEKRHPKVLMDPTDEDERRFRLRGRRSRMGAFGY